MYEAGWSKREITVKAPTPCAAAWCSGYRR